MVAQELADQIVMFVVAAGVSMDVGTGVGFALLSRIADPSIDERCDF
jgi:hypothetical protein